jgi:tripartite-type tricarboxylate transporter receptor subunit TctC
MKLRSRRQFLHLAAGAAALPAVSRMAQAQAYPSRPITIIVPFPAGGPSDAVARILAEPMRRSLGQPIIIENVAGANGSIGTGRVARAPPDGYTLVLGLWNTHVANGALYPLSYDVFGGFSPLALLVTFPYLIASKKTVPAKSLNELIAWLKANAGHVSQGSAGVGGAGHLAGLFFQKVTGTQFQHVPYRRSAPSMQDLVAGQVDLMFDAPLIILHRCEPRLSKLMRSPPEAVWPQRLTFPQ